MLNALRKNIRSVFFKILFAILVLSFALWGVGDMVRTVAVGGAAVEVGDTAVSSQEVARRYRSELRRLQQALGGDFNSEQARAMGVPDMVVQQIVTDALLREEARSLGIAVPDESVRQRIAENEAFRNELGRYDPNRVRAILAQAGLTEAAFIEAERADAIRERLMGAVAGAVAAPTTMVETLYQFREERRVAEAVLFAAADMPTPEAPDEATLRRFHEENPQPFTAPEYRSITLVRVAPDAVAESIEIDEATLREEFEYRRDEFQRPERRQVRQIVLDSESQAQQAQNVVAIGGDLEAVANEVGGEVVDLGWVERDSLLPELEEPIFALDTGAVSEPVRSPVGWHIFAVDSVEEGDAQDFEAVREQVEAAVRRDRAIDRIYDIVNAFEDERAAGATIEEAAEALELPVTQARIDNIGRTPEGTPPEEGALPRAVVEAAFETQAGFDTGMREIDGNVFFDLRVDEVTPPRLRDFESVREEVLAEWRAEQRRRAARDAARTALERVQAGEELAAIAADFGREVEVTEPFTRQASDGAPREMVARMFELERGRATVVDLPEGAVLARLREIVPARPSAGDEALRDLRQEVARGLGNDIAMQFLAALQRSHSVTVNRTKVEEAIP